jgi:hypothetical protein
VQHDCFYEGGFEGAFWCVAVVLEFGLLVFVLEDADHCLAPFFAHVGHLAVQLPVDVLLLAQVDQADSDELLVGLYLAPDLHYHPLHLAFWKLEGLVEHELAIGVVHWLFLCLVVELSVL